MRSLNAGRKNKQINKIGGARIFSSWFRKLTFRMTVSIIFISICGAGIVGFSFHIQKYNVLAELTTNAKGKIKSFQNSVLRLTGLFVRDILVVGRKRTEKDKLLKAVGLKPGDPIFGANLERIQTQIENLAWVKHAHIERRFPDTVFIKLFEREPLARWQRDGIIHLIDRSGQIIHKQVIWKFSDLPIVIGDKAPSLAAGFLDLLAKESDLHKRVRVVTRVSDRRWNVRVDNKINILLPEKNPQIAWSQLAEMERDHGVLGRDVIAIDMRLPNQLVVRVSPLTAERVKGKGRDT